MSLTYIKVCLLILEDQFGSVVRNVGEPLIKLGPLTLSKISSSSRIPLSSVRESLQVLIQHNLVTFKEKTPGHGDVLYTIDKPAIFLMLRYPKFCNLVKSKHGVEAELIFSNLITTGQIPLTKLFYILGSKHRDLNPNIDEKQLLDALTLYNKIFKILANEKLILRVDMDPNSNPNIPSRIPQESTGTRVPDLILKLICGQILSPNASVNEMSEQLIDSTWKINPDKLQNEMKEELLVNAMTKRTRDFGSGLIFKAILQEGLIRNPFHATTAAVNTSEIKSALRVMENGSQALKYFDDYLDRMTKDTHQFVVKTSDLHAGLYVANVKSAITELTWTTIESLIEAKHGMCASRIFRLVKTLKYAEQDHLLENCMLSTKVGSGILYRLVQDHFMMVKEIRKSYAVSAAVNKVVYVFYIDLVQLLHKLRQEMYKAIMNASLRLNYEKTTYSRFLAKEDRVDRILYYMTKSQCTEEQLEEVRETITVPERVILKKVHLYINKLTSAILHSDQTIFIIDTFLRYTKEH